MQDILSQTEIDSLLKALSSGELDTEQVEEKKASGGIIKYDFRRPNKYSKDQVRTLHMIHDNFSRMLSSFLSAYLRAGIQVKVASVDQTTYEDFIVSVSSPTLITVFGIKPKDEAVLFVMNSGFIFPIIDLVFGGLGEMANPRDLTDIEVRVMQKLSERILEQLTYAWEGVYDIQPDIISMENNPQFSHMYSPNETVAVVTMTTNVQGHDSLINLCLPYVALESIISKLSAQTWFATSGRSGSDLRPLFSRQLDTTYIDMSVVLGNTSISVREFLQLEIGDVIPLDNSVGKDIDLWVGKKKKFRVQPGISGGKFGVSVRQAIKVEEQRKAEGGETGE